MDFEQAKQAFELYLNGYDRKDEKVYLKIVHTYGVVDCSEEIAWDWEKKIFFLRKSLPCCMI